MPDLKYRFVLELYDEDGAALGRSPVTPDWLPAVEHAHFSAIRQERLPAVTAVPPSTIEPRWDPDSGEPYVTAVRVVLTPADGEPFSVEVPVDYFGTSAQQASAAYVKAGKLKAGDTFQYRVTAFAGEPPGDTARPPARAGVVVEEVPQPLPMVETALEPFLAASVLAGQDDPEDVSVFVPYPVIEQARARVREAPEVETGGILLGRLHRDPVRRDVVFIELSAQIPAIHTDRQAAKLTFTPQTWAAARAALDLRASDEAILGWWHSHPDWCKKCPPDKRKVCPLNGIFFSNDDCRLHRAVFPRAYHLGLLLSDREAGIIPTMFGWRRGMIASRAYHLLAPPDPALGRQPALTTTIGGTEHAHTEEAAHPVR
jgi:hypothetical protein